MVKFIIKDKLGDDGEDEFLDDDDLTPTQEDGSSSEARDRKHEGAIPKRRQLSNSTTCSEYHKLTISVHVICLSRVVWGTWLIVSNTIITVLILKPLMDFIPSQRKDVRSPVHV